MKQHALIPLIMQPANWRIFLTGALGALFLALPALLAHPTSNVPAGDRVSAYRIRSDFNVDLDEDLGWAAGVNQAPDQTVDTPFRIRFEVESSRMEGRRQYSLQYRWNYGPWRYMEAQHFPYPSAGSPPASVIGCVDCHSPPSAARCLT